MLENERRYVAQELHDGIAQTTLQLGLQAGICRKMLERSMLEMLTKELADLETRIQMASTQVRELIADMRPPQLEAETSLVDYLQNTIDTHQERGGALVEFHSHLMHTIPDFLPQQKLTIQRIVQEALFNIRKHAHATGVSLSLTDDAHNFYLSVKDNGRGFDVAEVEARPVERRGGGLANMRARARVLGGDITIQSDLTSGGTELKLTLPRSRK